MPDSTSCNIAALIERWRTELLDLSKRNRLINFKTGRTGGILLVHPDPGELWDHLVIRSKALSFPWKRDLIDLSEEPGEANSTIDPSPGAAPPLSAQEILERCRCSPRLRSHHLLTDLDDQLLAARLTRLALRARESQTEQGVVTLYVAFGFLRWFESPDSKEEIRSPLLLVPVSLKRESVNASWQLQADDEEVLPNHSLAQLLSRDFGRRLRVDDEAVDWEDPAWRTSYFAEVEQAIRSEPRWEVLDEAALGTFNFQKLAMWDDLGRNQARIERHSLCRALAGDRTVALCVPSDLPQPEELDYKVRPAETYHILDSDSSQHAAIIAAVRGANLVLDGPPGTGKSQTIANLIAEFLAAGKTVLFVSEKAAALEVVKKRLDARGLGDFCLDLHSHKASKRAVLAELKRCLDLVPEHIRDPDEELRQLDEVRRQLNQYVRQLHAVRRPLGQSVFQVHGVLAQLARLTSRSHCPIPWVLERDAAYVQRIMERLVELRDCRGVIECRGRHPWRGCRADAPAVTLPDDVAYHFQRLAQGLPRVKEATAFLHRLGLAPDRPTWGEWQTALANARRALRSPFWWEPASRQRLQDIITEWVDCRRTVESVGEELRTRLAPPAFAAANAALVYRASWFRSRWKRLLPSWWFLKARLKTWYTGRPPDTLGLVADLQMLALYHQCLSCCRQVEEEFTADLLHDIEEKPDWPGTLACLRQIEQLERAGEPVRSRLEEAVRQSDAALAEGLNASWKFLTQLFDPAAEVSTGIILGRTSLDDLRTWLAERIADVHCLLEWVRFREIQQELAAAGVSAILEEVLQGQVKLDEAADAFHARFLRLWLDAVYQQSAELRQFQGERHERLLERFRKLDRRSVESASARIRQRLLTDPDRPRFVAANVPGSSELGVLLREVNKTRGHLPLRKLFAAVPTRLPRLKPCLMMSPLAVSTYLPPDMTFDLVIFDEASQVRPCDAICAIYRGRQLVVAGDPKQLPPTTFFERLFDDEEGADAEEGADLGDFESILDVCYSLGLLRRRLRWHYRSRRESLIAFSNRHFYDNELVTFPSAHDLPANPAILFEYVPDGRWKVGRGGGFNAVEARRTAERVLEHFRDHPEQSLGVIAFNLHQQMRIQDELEQLRRAHPEREEFFQEDRDEPFFVKNLENVQGDERDVIFLSVGYGPDETGRVAMRFGPLNQQGGERRLNVAVTRARQQVRLISSLRAPDIDLSRTNAVGVRLLRAYLDYAERGPSALAGAITEAGARGFDSPFEQAVCEELTRRGLTVHSQVGCSGFRIDLALVDADCPGRYLLGVECDGAAYHSSATARDRDRLRQEVLESLGWRICRIWSTDWLRDREGQVRRVLAALAKARQEAAHPSPAAPAPPAPCPRAEAPGEPQEPAVPAAVPSYRSIDDVPGDALRAAVLDVLRSCGNTGDEDLVKAVRAQLGFERTGPRIRERIETVIHELLRAGTICRTADGRLQVAPGVQAAKR
ncbi:MAG TPA: DUF4011 domain-containing protein [Gemmataceae bacterium]|nr:DUF4011 domain-containing protein [Gemmataceae bacterium]